MICTALSQSVYAADTISFDDEDTNISESFEPTDDSTEFDDVQLISTQIDNGVIRSSYSVNLTISANKYKQDNKALHCKMETISTLIWKYPRNLRKISI